VTTLLPDQEWWKRGIIYQIYPRSFQDTNGDGVGDLNGIRERLDYLTWLGVDAIWICPVFPSPMVDFGYDISNYCAIDPLFGKLGDFDHLVAAAHARGLKLILDYVPNHTSDQHPWFKESRSSRDNAKRDWYIWRDGKPDGSPPNNWVSQFGGSAWTRDDATGQYYLHSFLPQQPDLNWRNPDVRKAMFSVLRFWLDRGVDGFRIDVLWLLIKDATFRDNPSNPAYTPDQPAINRTLSVHNSDQPEIHALIAEMRGITDEYLDRLLIGEIYLPFDRLMTYYGSECHGVQLPFNFALIHAAWTPQSLAALITDYEKALPAGGWPNWVLGNHDQPRIAARVGAQQARNAAMLLLTLRGTPTMYYGDEIGLARVPIAPDQMQDPWERNEPGLNVSRDPWRTPMQWDGSLNSGFTTSPRPWLPLDPNYREQNVERLRANRQSLLQLYRRLIDIRRRHPALRVGDCHVLSPQNNIFLYERSAGDEALLIALNLWAEPAPLALPNRKEPTILLSTYLDRDGPATDPILRSGEGVIVRVR
jgi:alpha-glucosidase